MTIVCLGEAIVDLVCERELDSSAEADEYRPHFGGALANVAVSAARAGAPVALAGGAGDDEWGRWLRRTLEKEGVDLRWFSLVPGPRTPICFITFDRRREPSFQVYGEGIEASMRSLDGRVADVLAEASALVFGSNTLVGERERELTLHARDVALARRIPVLYDPNLRANRWAAMDGAIELSRLACEGAFVARANLDEARRIARLEAEASAAEVAEAMVGLGARIAVVTVGARGALMRGEASAEVAGVTVDLVSPLGAGDAFMGALAAGFARRGWSAANAPQALAEAVAAGGLACTAWGALP